MPGTSTLKSVARDRRKDKAASAKEGETANAETGRTRAVERRSHGVTGGDGGADAFASTSRPRGRLPVRADDEASVTAANF